MEICFSGDDAMPDFDFIRTELGRLRTQVGRQRREVLALQRAGTPSASAEALLQRMRDTLDGLCARLRAEQIRPLQREASGGRPW